MSVLKVGIMGCGSIGTVIAKAVDRDAHFELSYMLDNDMGKCEALAKKLKSSPKAVVRVADMEGADLIIEAASQECVSERAINALDISDLMVMSVGAFSDDRLLDQVMKKAAEKRRRIYVPSGAVAGLDGIKAACSGKVDYVRLTTRKPPASFDDAPWVMSKDMSMKAIRKPTVIFEGTARDAARWFPKNVNVAMSLSLAGLGADKTAVRIIADPFTDRNVHEIEAEGAFGRLSVKTENLPSPQNRKTSHLAALSAVATLKRIADSVQIGT